MFFRKKTASTNPPTPEDATKNRTVSSDILKRVRDIQIKTRHLVNHMMIGEYLSAFKGMGMEFSEVREYQPGDDLRLIDWNVTARMNHPYIKQFREEREMTLMLLVDVSSSGLFGSSDKSKNEIAAEMASILAYTAIKNNDKVGLIIFTDHVEHYIPPQKGRSHVWNVIRTILNFSPEKQKTAIKQPLDYLLKVVKRKCVAFLISDFQDEGYQNSLRLCRQKHDLIAILIHDPLEDKMPAVGLIHLNDKETGESLTLNSSDTQTMQKISALSRDKRNRLKKQLLGFGVDTIDIETTGSLISPIIKFFKKRETRH